MKRKIKEATELKKNVVTLMNFLQEEHPFLPKDIGLSQHPLNMKTKLTKIIDFYIEQCEAQLKEDSSIIEIAKEDIYDVPGTNWDMVEKDWDAYEKRTEENYKKLQEIDTRCKNQKRIVGRYIDISVADGKAIYQVQKINMATEAAYVKICNGINDGYMDDYFGPECWCSLQYVTQLIKARDVLGNLFASKKK